MFLQRSGPFVTYGMTFFPFIDYILCNRKFDYMEYFQMSIFAISKQCFSCLTDGYKIFFINALNVAN